LAIKGIKFGQPTDFFEGISGIKFRIKNSQKTLIPAKPLGN